MQTFSPRAGVTIAYNRTPGTAPGIMFLGGFRSDMTGIKAMFLEEQARARGQACLRFDYTGHGGSSGKFEDATVGAWLQDTLDAFDTQTEGPQIVVGSSLGGWLALLLAVRRPERVKGLVLLAAAPDFTVDLLRMFSPPEKALLRQNGLTYRPNAYGSPHPFTQALFEDADKYLVLTGPIPVQCPVRLIHGKKDIDVPWQKTVQTREKLPAENVEIIWVEDGDHRLGRPQDLALIDKTVMGLAAMA